MPTFQQILDRFALPAYEKQNHLLSLIGEHPWLLDTEEDIAAFKGDPILQANLLKSFKRILAFPGLSLSDKGEVLEGQNFKARVPDAWASPNHNWLRIARILRSLTLLGMKTHGQAFIQWLDAIYRSRKFPISADTFRYWTQAVTE
ncbi:MAG: hypothetical protein EXR98_04705 [Gemmataceae bacterium]|nr:hypothetical protein [Gemmataceae bacterium]